MKRAAELFKEMRLSKGWSQQRIARAIGYSTSGQYISNFERGLSGLPYVAIHKAIDILTVGDHEKKVMTQSFSDLISLDEAEKFMSKAPIKEVAESKVPKNWLAS
jgi:transcriptional regulator with XRE-family HTH domain